MKTFVIVAAVAALCIMSTFAAPEPDPEADPGFRRFGGYGGYGGFGGYGGYGGGFGGFRGYGYGRKRRSADPEPAAEPEANPGYRRFGGYGGYGGFGGYGGYGGYGGFNRGFGGHGFGYGR